MPRVNGWEITDAGRATVVDAAVSDAHYLHGAAYKSDGTRFVILDTGSLPSGAVNLNGTAHTSDGRMIYVTSLPSPAFFNNGIAHNERGAIFLDNSTVPDWFLAGIGVTNAGALCTTGLP